MHTQETKHKFLELRARDMSFRRISEELGVDKNTLLRWNREFAAEIHNLHQIELENLQQQILGSKAERLQALARDYQRYSQELDKRNPAHIPQHRLFHMVCRLRDQVERRITPVEFVPEPAEQSQSMKASS